MLERFYNTRDVHTLKGKTVTGIAGLYHGSRELSFLCSDGTEYKMCHAADGAETVCLYDMQRLGVSEVPACVRLSDDDCLVRLCEDALLGTVNYAERIVLDREELPGYFGKSGRLMGIAKTLFLLSTENGVVALTWAGFTDDPYASTVTDFVQTGGEGLWRDTEGDA